MTLERILLQTIKFDLMVEHPYTYLLKFAKLIKGKCLLKLRRELICFQIFMQSYFQKFCCFSSI